MSTRGLSQIDGVFTTLADLVVYKGKWKANQQVTVSGTKTNWKFTGNVIAASQTPALTGNATLSDANGNEFSLVTDGAIKTSSLGASPSESATVNTAAIKAGITAINALGAGKLIFEPKGIYNVYPQGSIPAGNSPFMAFNSLSYIDIDYRGSTLNFESTFINNDTVDIHKFTACSNITIKNNETISPVEIPAERADRGIIFASYLQGCKNVKAFNNKQTGGKNGHLFLRNPVAGDPLSYKTDVANIEHETVNVAYPLTTAYSGDNVTAFIKSDGALRSYFPYGVEGHKVKVVSKNHLSDDCLLTVETFSTTEATERKLKDINLEYTNVERTTAEPSNPCITVRFVGTNAGNMDDIRIKYNCKNDATYPLGRIVYMLKQSAFGVTDTVARGHNLRGIKIAGVLDGAIAAQPVLDLMNDGAWQSGDFVRRFTVEDTVVTGNTTATATILANAVVDRINIENVTFSGDLTVPGTYQVGVNYRNLLANNQSRDVTFIDSGGGTHGLTP